MAKGKNYGKGPTGRWSGDYICPMTQVVTDRMPDVVFEVDRDEDGWTFRSTPVTEEVDFIIGLEAMGFKHLGGAPIEAPDLCEEFDDAIERLRSTFVTLDPAEQARIVSALWDHT